jgi:hypothetical protein
MNYLSFFIELALDSTRSGANYRSGLPPRRRGNCCPDSVKGFRRHVGVLLQRLDMIGTLSLPLSTGGNLLKPDSGFSLATSVPSSLAAGREPESRQRVTQRFAIAAKGFPRGAEGYEPRPDQFVKIRKRHFRQAHICRFHDFVCPSRLVNGQYDVVGRVDQDIPRWRLLNDKYTFCVLDKLKSWVFAAPFEDLQDGMPVDFMLTSRASDIESAVPKTGEKLVKNLICCPYIPNLTAPMFSDVAQAQDRGRKWDHWAGPTSGRHKACGANCDLFIGRLNRTAPRRRNLRGRLPSETVATAPYAGKVAVHVPRQRWAR